MFGFPIPIVNLTVYYGIGFILLAMFVRAIASWFGITERYAFIRFLARITDPFIEPVRRLAPPIWRIDIAFFITWFLLRTIQILLLQGLPTNW